MAQEWAKWFYNSKAWKECRKAYVLSVNGLCERCLQAQRIRPGKILHHTIVLTPENINDPNISLNWELLRFDCKECHEDEHNPESRQATASGMMFDEDGDLISVR